MIVDAHVSRVGHIMKGVGKGDLNGLQLLVTGLGAVLLAEIELLEDIQRHQRHDALAVGRNLAHLVAAIIHPDGLHPLRLIGGQILIAEVAAKLFALGVDLPGDGAGIKGVGVCPADGLQSVGVAGRRIISPAS
jgi:hypothetical protein